MRLTIASKLCLSLAFSCSDLTEPTFCRSCETSAHPFELDGCGGSATADEADMIVAVAAQCESYGAGHPVGVIDGRVATVNQEVQSQGSMAGDVPRFSRLLFSLHLTLMLDAVRFKLHQALEHVCPNVVSPTLSVSGWQCVIALSETNCLGQTHRRLSKLDSPKQYERSTRLCSLFNAVPNCTHPIHLSSCSIQRFQPCHLPEEQEENNLESISRPK